MEQFMNHVCNTVFKSNLDYPNKLQKKLSKVEEFAPLLFNFHLIFRILTFVTERFWNGIRR